MPCVPEWFCERTQLSSVGLKKSASTAVPFEGLRAWQQHIIEISKTLGHSTCSTTMNIYAHSFEEQQEEVATKVNEFLRLNA